MAACGQDNWEECVTVVRDMKTVVVPCTRNIYQKYTVQVPREVKDQVPRTVTYTDYENRSKQVPYTVNRSEKRVRMETRTFQVPVTKYYKKTVMETRERQVPVEYYVNVPETKYRTVTEQVPVQRSMVQLEDVVKTVYDTETRTQCVPKTKIVTKQIPVYSVVPKPARPCPPVDDDELKEYAKDFGEADTNKDNVISFDEYTAARAKGKLSEIVNNEPPKYVD